MCDCPDTPDVQPEADTTPADIFTLPPLDTGDDVAVPDMYSDLLALVEAHPGPAPGPDSLLSPLDPNAPTLADIEGHLDTINTNVIDPYPGFTADYNDVTNEVDWTPDP